MGAVEGRNADIWIFDIARGVRTLLTSDPTRETGPKWSPAGDQIVFKRRDGQHPGLYLKSSSGTASEEMLLESNLFPDDWSRDGRTLLYETEDLKTTWDIWTLPLGDRKPRSFIQAEGRQEFARLSPDGRWVAYRSNETGRFEVYVVPFPKPNRKSIISTAGGTYPRWRRDGREIFYVTPSPDNTLMAAEVNGQGATFQIGAVRPLFKMQPRAGSYPYDVSADGQRILVNTLTTETASAPITVVVNWVAALRK